ncbi:MAG: ribonuclease R, partial [bacterium]|nr:ribonuclease R [bacterium]
MVKKKNPHIDDPYSAREAQNYENPIASREHILSVIVDMKKPVKRHALVKYFSLSDPDQEEALRRRVKAMVRDGQLLKTPAGYLPITDMETVTGVLVIEREAEGHLRTLDERIITLYGPTLRGYFDGDEVVVQIIEIDNDGSARGR